ncbi:MAG: hypothetical protein DYH20_08355 [Gammaproteobacteria bacterium PRO9]|nr:hypothetical protein [Gammaproteobacteria bacterium PRO9]
MEASSPHNLREPLPEPATLRYGIRVTMPSSDPMRAVLGADWHREHWFATSAERNAALREMASRHAYSRIGDAPSIRLAAIDR